MKPTKTEILEHYKQGISEDCLVCGEKLRGYWTDYNGQIKCWTCGMTYQILGCHLKEEYLEKYNLRPEDIAKRYCDAFSCVPIYKDYYQQTKRALPIGTYLGNPPWSKDDSIAFWNWLAQNKTKYRPEYEEDFYWDKMIAKYGDAELIQIA